MLKKSLLTIGLALAACGTTFANLGDTVDQSNNRYGAPTAMDGNVQTYVKNGYLIVEIFDANGIVQGINYEKLNGTVISKEESNLLDKVNIDPVTLGKAQWKSLGWKPQPDVIANSYVSTGGTFYQWTLGWFRMDDGKWVSCYTVDTKAGLELKKANPNSMNTNNNPNQVPI
jgi:hypothetical protein